MSQTQPVIPGIVYPQSESVVQPSPHSRGSFGPVFIVLAVIIVLAMLACFLGRLLARRFANLNARHSGRAPRPSVDIEDSFEINISGPPPGRHGDRMGHGGRKEAKVAAGNGEIRGAAAQGKHGEHGEPKQSSA